jgi:hypothetical protein
VLANQPFKNRKRCLYDAEDEVEAKGARGCFLTVCHLTEWREMVGRRKSIGSEGVRRPGMSSFVILDDSCADSLA